MCAAMQAHFPGEQFKVDEAKLDLLIGRNLEISTTEDLWEGLVDDKIETIIAGANTSSRALPASRE